MLLGFCGMAGIGVARDDGSSVGGAGVSKTKNVIHEGTPHGNAELADSEIVLKPISFLIY